MEVADVAEKFSDDGLLLVDLGQLLRYGRAHLGEPCLVQLKETRQRRHFLQVIRDGGVSFLSLLLGQDVLALSVEPRRLGGGFVGLALLHFLHSLIDVALESIAEGLHLVKDKDLVAAHTALGGQHCSETGNLCRGRMS